LANLLEYALDRDPLASGSTAATTAAMASQAHLTLTFFRARPASELTYQVWGSSDLVTWTKVGPENPGTVGQNVTITDTPLPGEVRRFLRLQVIAP
jgi:hypothetical protein